MQQQQLLPGLPDELALAILAGLPLCKLASLRSVSRSWHRTTASSADWLSLRASLCVRQPLLLLQRWQKKRENEGALELSLLDPFSGARRPIPPLHMGLATLPYYYEDLATHGSTILAFYQNSALFSLDLGGSLQWHRWSFSSDDANAIVGFDEWRIVFGTHLYVIRASRHASRLNIRDALRRPAASSTSHGTIGSDGIVDHQDSPLLQWESLPPLCEARYGASLVAWDGKMIALGGLNPSYKEKHFSGEVWDTSMQPREWTLIPELWPASLFSHNILRPTVAVIEGQLCAFSQIKDHILFYEEHMKRWISWICIGDLFPNYFTLNLFFVVDRSVWALNTYPLTITRTENAIVSSANLPNDNLLGMKTLHMATDEPSEGPNSSSDMLSSETTSKLTRSIFASKSNICRVLINI
ncbi:hypothetical protein L7F22_006600 [Adiantum nelumboides]|nr:hypothetical protein [Adiantum nelumboides]